MCPLIPQATLLVVEQTYALGHFLAIAPATRVSLKATTKIVGSNWNKICFGCFVKPKTKDFGLFRCFEPILKQTETNRNNPKFSEKYQNMISIKLFRLLVCLFWFNQNTETLCFGVEPKQPKQMFCFR
jgi:hypothetical protein